MNTTPTFEKRFLGLKGCEECRGSGLRSTENDNGYSVMVRCDCYHKARIEPMIKAAGIPKNHRAATAKGMKPETENEIRAMAAVKRWLDNYTTGDKGLFFTGPEGTGKTRLLCAIAIELIKKRPIGSPHPLQPFYWTAAELIAAAKESFDYGRSEEARQDPIVVAKTCTVLVLDDLGAEHNSPWAVSSIIEVIDARYSNGLTTLMASNLDTKALAKRYDPRMAGRIREMTTVLILDGESRRLESTI